MGSPLCRPPIKTRTSTSKSARSKQHILLKQTSKKPVKSQRRQTRPMLPQHTPRESPFLASTEGVNIVSGLDATRTLIHGYLNPFESSDAVRIPDLFTLCPTCVDSDYSAGSQAIANGTTGADGSAAWYLRGEGNSNLVAPASISAAHAITWAGGSAINYLGSVPTSALSRVVGAAWRFTYISVGDPHDVIFNVMEIPPSTCVTATFTNFPTATNVGPTVTQRECFGARSFRISSGETVQLTALPMDHRCCTFMLHSGSRTDSGLSGFIVWAYGLKSTDSLTLEIRIRFEFEQPTVETASSVNFDSALVKSNAAAMDRGASAVTDAIALGMNVTKAPSGTLPNVFSQAVDALLKAEGLSDKMINESLKTNSDRPWFDAPLRSVVNALSDHFFGPGLFPGFGNGVFKAFYHTATNLPSTHGEPEESKVPDELVIVPTLPRPIPTAPPPQCARR